MTRPNGSAATHAPIDVTAGHEPRIRAANPVTGDLMEPEFRLNSPLEVDQTARLAATAFMIYRRTTPEAKAGFLETIAVNIEAVGEDLVSRAMLETGLSRLRLVGELARTTNQLRLFAAALRAGNVGGIRVDPALPDRTPAPRPDIRMRKIPLGPVAVFGSSNFPFAFSNAGGDTASALAAGCPVIVKSHSAHPGTAELATEAIRKSVRESGLPDGVYGALLGSGKEIGALLVSHPEIKAVGFTGSRSGGLALARIASERPEPIPVFAEMSSVNPVFIFESGLPGTISRDYFDALTLGSGQFCTNPGLLFLPKGELGDNVVRDLARMLQSSTGQTMLTHEISSAYEIASARLGAIGGVETVARGSAGAGANAPPAAVYEVSCDRFANEPALCDEVFGATSLIVRYSEPKEMLDAAVSLDGQLTATVHAAMVDEKFVRELVGILELKAGRIIHNGWPTGVEVGHAMVHGGPFPASSNSRTTSVGTLSVERFQRPVAYQNFPESLLPEELREDNPWGQVRTVNGRIEGA